MNATASDSLGPVTAPQLRREAGRRTAVEALACSAPGLPAVTVHRLPSEVPEAMSPAGEARLCRVHGHVVPGLVQHRLGGLLIQQHRDGDGGRCHRHAGDGREAPPDADHGALPDRLVQRRLARRDGLERLVEPPRQVLLVADVHCCPPSTSSVLVRSAARAREAWLFTVPTEQPSVTAASVSVSPTQ